MGVRRNALPWDDFFPFLLCRWCLEDLYLVYEQRNWYDVTSRVIESAHPLASAFRLPSSDVGVRVPLPALGAEVLGCLDRAVLG